MERPFEPISNPAGHQLGSTSIIQLAIPDPPFPIDDSLPQGDHIGPVHLSSSGAIGVEAFLTPEGPQPLLMSHSLPLTFPERSMHILINHTLRSTWWLAEWHPITMKHFVFSMTMKSGNGAQAADSTLNYDSFRRWITIASEGPWCTEALVGLRQYISLELDRVKQDWNGSQRSVNGSVNTANIAFEFTVLETFSTGVCAYVWEYSLAIYTSAHTVCVYEGLLPHHSNRMDIRQQWN